MRIQSSLIALLTLAVASSTAMGQMTNLHVGDQAPGLDVSKWVKGDEISIESGKVYIVEFWATWCVPCRKSIPHLTEIQKEYGDQGLHIIGVSTEDEKLVSNFVRAQGSKMDYTVVVDKFNSTERAWMQASGSNSIPNAFIVDRNGKVQYIGNPLSDEFDTIVSLVVRGRYDAKLMAQATPHLQAAETARKIKNWQLASKHLMDIYALDQHVFAQLLLEQFEMILVDQENPTAAYMFARKIMEERGPADPELMMWLADKIIGDPKIAAEDRNIDVATAAAEVAMQYARPDDPAPRSVMASVHFHKGDVDQAVALQTQAWMIAPPKQKADYKRQLESYQQAAARSAARASTK
jgi:thiol-disulfide isomerase/thioredoxin